MSTRLQPNGPYFIYGLIDPKVYRETKDELQSIFYVGKGKDARSHQHEKDVRKALRDEEILHERLDSKAHRIHQILDRGERVPIIYLAEGIVDEDDAYEAEQLAMTLVDGLLRRSAGGSLTNVASGRKQGIRRVGESDLGGISEWEARLRKDNVEIGSRSLDMETVGSVSVLLVKGNRAHLTADEHRLSPHVAVPSQVADFSTRINVLAATDAAPAVRRGWDPDDPWGDVDARERARRYWRLGAGNVGKWLRDPQTLPTHLLMGIPTATGDTVVRYAWHIDPEGVWEFFPDRKAAWGIPLAGRDHQHHFLNHALYEATEAGRKQVLLGHAGGWRHLVR
ncbi:GIY-YIG nuclease family protein [Nocardia sp. NPDC058640]|uniref:GIY-YIG nuclease family protein n=1 Tax=Nocardia sp. NPDC058640 TaxID=3346571 RepID=UPI00365131D6